MNRFENRFGEASEKLTLLEARLWLNNFGETFRPSGEDGETKFESHTPLSVRPPEFLFAAPKRAPVSFSSNIWMLACAVWAILGQRPLFESFLGDQDTIMCEQIDALGRSHDGPLEWRERWEAYPKFCSKGGEPLAGRAVRSLEDRFEDGIQQPRRNLGMEHVSPDNRAPSLRCCDPCLYSTPETDVR